MVHFIVSISVWDSYVVMHICRGKMLKVALCDCYPMAALNLVLEEQHLYSVWVVYNEDWILQFKVTSVPFSSYWSLSHLVLSTISPSPVHPYSVTLIHTSPTRSLSPYCSPLPSLCCSLLQPLCIQFHSSPYFPISMQNLHPFVHYL